MDVHENRANFMHRKKKENKERNTKSPKTEKRNNEKILEPDNLEAKDQEVNIDTDWCTILNKIKWTELG